MTVCCQEQKSSYIFYYFSRHPSYNFRILFSVFEVFFELLYEYLPKKKFFFTCGEILWLCISFSKSFVVVSFFEFSSRCTRFLYLAAFFSAVLSLSSSFLVSHLEFFYFYVFSFEVFLGFSTIIFKFSGLPGGVLASNIFSSSIAFFLKS